MGKRRKENGGGECSGQIMRWSSREESEMEKHRERRRFRARTEEW